MSHEQLQQIIINQLDLERVSPDIVGAVLVRLTEQALLQFTIDAYDALELADQKEFKRLLAGSGRDEIRSFLDIKLDGAMTEISEVATKKVVGEYQKLRLEAAAA